MHQFALCTHSSRALWHALSRVIWGVVWHTWLSAHCNSLQLAATHSSRALRHTGSYGIYSSVHTATLCNTLQHSATHSCRALWHTESCGHIWLKAHCNTLQHTATHSSRAMWHTESCSMLRIYSGVKNQLKQSNKQGILCYHIFENSVWCTKWNHFSARPYASFKNN